MELSNVAQNHTRIHNAPTGPCGEKPGQAGPLGEAPGSGGNGPSGLADPQDGPSSSLRALVENKKNHLEVERIQNRQQVNVQELMERLQGNFGGG